MTKLFLYLIFSTFLTLSAQESVCSKVKIQINQELTLERQAFEATMKINNGLADASLTDVAISVNFQDKDGDPITATNDPDQVSSPDNNTPKFFIRVNSKDNIDDIEGQGEVNSSTEAVIKWLIIPSKYAGGEDPDGTQYKVGATLTFKVKGEERTIEVIPDTIFVKPMPDLQLDYFIPNDVYGDDPFTQEIEPAVPFSLGVRVKNNGFGAAKKLKINSGQPKIIENEQGLLVNYKIIGSEVNGEPATNSLLVDFGDIESQSAGNARWLMTSSLSGSFEEFSASFTHADELGGQLTSLIGDIKTHFLVRDVLVDLPGRDQVRDFLGFSDNKFKVYESNGNDFDVTNQSAQLTYLNGTLTRTPQQGFIYGKIQVDASFDGKIITARRSDGKSILSDNIWASKTLLSDGTWEYYLNIFDYQTEVLSSNVSYVLDVKVDESLAKISMSGVIDKVVEIGEAVSMNITASVAGVSGANPTLSFRSLSPTDASFSNGAFAWTPDKEGTFVFTFYAKYNDLIVNKTARISVVPANDPEVSFEKPELEVVENQEEEDILIKLSHPSKKEVKVNYSLSSNDADFGVDYTLTAGEAVFAPGETTYKVRLLLNNDDVEEVTETLTLSLASPTNATLSTESETDVKILDDDISGAIFIADNNKILKFSKDGATSLGDFISNINLENIGGFTFGFDGNLYVTNNATDSIMRFDGVRGEFIDEFSAVDQLNNPGKIQFGFDGNLYVVSENRLVVLNPADGEFLHYAVEDESLTEITDFSFTNTGKLFITDRFTGSLLKYNPANGQKDNSFVPPENLNSPAGIISTDDNKLILADNGNDEILIIDLSDGTLSRLNDLTKFSKPEFLSLNSEGQLLFNSSLDQGIHKYDFQTQKYSLDLTGEYDHIRISHFGLGSLSPVIKVQPLAQLVEEGDSALFKVSVTGSASMKFQWKKNGENIPGAIYPVYFIEEALPPNAGIITCEITNYKGSVTTTPVSLSVRQSFMAVDDSYAIDEDNTLTVAAAVGVLSNDQADGTTALVRTLPSAEQGSLSFSSDGSFTFTPVKDFYGSVSFTYYLKKGLDESEDATVTISINAVDDAPSIAAEITDKTVDEDAAPFAVSLAGTFTDVDNEDTQITFQLLSNSDTGLLSASLSGNALTITPLQDAYGSSTLTLRATSNGKSVDTSFAVTVNAVDDAPVVANQIAAQEVDEDSAATVINISNVFTDVDDDVILKSVHSNSNVNLLSASVNGENLTLAFIPDAHGSSTVTVRGTANGKSVDTSFAVTVNAVDDAPVVSAPLANRTVDEDAADLLIPLTGVFTDVDNDNASISVSVKSNSNSSLLSTSINGNVLTVSLLPDQHGLAQITLLATSNGLTVEDSFSVTVNAVDDDPVVSAPLADRTVDEDAAALLVPLSGVFTDVDNENSQIAVSVKSNTNQTLLSTGIQNGVLSIELLKDQHGVAQITLLAASNGLTVEDSFAVTVNPVNDAPVVDGAEALELNEDEVKEWTKAEFLSLINAQDVDSNNLTVILTNPSNVTTSTANGKVLLTPVANYYGNATVQYKVSDGELESNTGTLSINYKAVNDAPQITSINSSLQTDEDTSLTVSGISVSDLDAQDGIMLSTVTVANGILSVTGQSGAVINGNNSSQVTISANLQVLNNVLSTLNYSPGENYFGDESLIVLVNDNGNTGSNGPVDALIALKQIQVTVNPVDDAPVVNVPLNAVNVDEDSAATVFNLGSLFTDVDNEDSEITKEIISNGADSLISAQLNGNQLTLSYLANAFGNTSITIRGSSGEQTVDFVLDVSVSPVDDAPEVANALADLGVDEDSAPIIIDLTSTFTDIDNDDSLIVKSVSSNTNQSLLSTSISGNQLTLTLIENAFGTADITVLAESNGETISDTFNILVNSVNDAPVAISDPGYAVEKGGSVEIPIIGNDYDVDGEIAIDSVQITELSGGSLAIDRFTGKVTFRHDQSLGNDLFFYYTIKDKEGLISNEARVSINLNGDHENFPEWIVCRNSAHTDCSVNSNKWKKTVSGYKPWKEDDSTASEGHYSLKSHALNDGDKSAIEFTDNFSSGPVSFDIKVSSSPEDTLSFYVDGELIKQWSGEIDWKSESFNLNEGTHTLRWVYKKDDSGAQGQDAAWIDNFIAPGLIDLFPYDGKLESHFKQPGSTEFWSVNDKEVSTGDYSLKSKLTNDGDVSELETSLIFKEDGTVSFDLKLDANPEDIFEFLIDDQVIISKNGTLNWESFQADISAGEHTLKWIFRKTSNKKVSYAWLDSLKLPNYKTNLHTLKAFSNGDGSVTPVELVVIDGADAVYTVSSGSNSNLSIVYLDGEELSLSGFDGSTFTVENVFTSHMLFFLFEDEAQESWKKLLKSVDLPAGVKSSEFEEFYFSLNSNNFINFTPAINSGGSSLPMVAIIESGQLMFLINSDGQIDKVVVTFVEGSPNPSSVVDGTLFVDMPFNSGELFLEELNLFEIISHYEDISYLEIEAFLAKGNMEFQILAND